MFIHVFYNQVRPGRTRVVTRRGEEPNVPALTFFEKNHGKFPVDVDACRVCTTPVEYWIVKSIEQVCPCYLIDFSMYCT
jgi:hypothetical protein